jgi:GT2 family glycosyltransferase
MSSSQQDQPGHRPTITAIAVLYKRSIAESEAVASLCRILEERPDLKERPHWKNRFALILYDNSPEPQAVPAGLPIPLTYVHDAANGGLGAAYNYALEAALRADTPWLLLLDQDTHLTHDYLQELLDLLATAADDQRIAAFVPKLAGLTGLRSPSLDYLDSLRRQVTLPRWRRPLIAPETTYGAQPRRLTAFNSGAVLRTSAVQAIGGFPRAYWLDFLDMAVFHDLYQQGGYIFVMRSVLEHSLSVEASEFLSQPGSLARHRNILRAMVLYVRSRGSLWERLLHRAWLIRNGLALLFKSGGARFAWASFRQALLYSSGSTPVTLHTQPISPATEGGAPAPH